MRHFRGHPAIVEIYDSDIVYDEYGTFSEVYLYVSTFHLAARRSRLIRFFFFPVGCDSLPIGGALRHDFGRDHREQSAARRRELQQVSRLVLACAELTLS